MNDNVKSILQKFTENFMDHPLNAFFISPVDPEKDGVFDYFDIIHDPIDLSTIKNKIQSNEYRYPRDWYEDMKRVYTNAITYHSAKENLIYVWMAQFLLDDLQKHFSFLGIDNKEKWNEVLINSISKLGQAISDSTVPQGPDDLIMSTIKRAEGLPTPTSSSVNKMLKYAKILLNDSSFRYGFLTIARRNQKIKPLSGTNITPKKVKKVKKSSEEIETENEKEDPGNPEITASATVPSDELSINSGDIPPNEEKFDVPPEKIALSYETENQILIKLENLSNLSLNALICYVESYICLMKDIPMELNDEMNQEKEGTEINAQ